MTQSRIEPACSAVLNQLHHLCQRIMGTNIIQYNTLSISKTDAAKWKLAC